MTDGHEPGRVTAIAALLGLAWTGWFAGLLLGSTFNGVSGPIDAGRIAFATIAIAGTLAGTLARRIRHDPWTCVGLSAIALTVLGKPVGQMIGLAEPGIAPWVITIPYAAVAVLTLLILAPGHNRVVRGIVVAASPLLLFLPTSPAGAWIASASLRKPTEAMVLNNNVDMSVDTHQWLASQAMTILANDGNTAITSFLSTPDPTAPFVNDRATGLPTSVTETYGWRLLQGARDADGALYSQIPDHFHNWWTHQGKWWIVGGSAANGAERAFGNAKEYWAQGDRSNAIYWLGAALHLVDDACVPQHEFYGLNVYHHQYERWVQIHQDELTVDRGGIYADQFRVDTGHGGPAWSSAHPRGWVDECAHRAADNLLAATHPNPPDPSTSGSQWRTAPHIAATQRLSAGFVAFFFSEVGGI